MAVHNPAGGLTAEEKRVVKALLAKNWRNQDIQHLLNSGGRKATVNSARITVVKQTDSIKPASDAEVEDFMARKQLFDPATGLNALDDERLIRAREAMILAVQVFNGPGYKFKAELFAVLANIAWTYLLHEFYARKKVAIVGADGRSLLLGQMVERHDCPLSSGIKNNLRAMKIIRDEVEHLLLKRSDNRQRKQRIRAIVWRPLSWAQVWGVPYIWLIISMRACGRWGTGAVTWPTFCNSSRQIGRSL